MIPTRYNRMGLDTHHRTRWVINHGAGVLDIEINNSDNLLWTFPDASTSTLARPQKTVTAGTTIVTCNDFSKNGLLCYLYATATALTNNKIPAKSLPDFRYLFYCANNFLTGRPSDIPRVSNTLFLYGDGISGAITELPRVTSVCYVFNLPSLTGSATNMPSVTGEKRLYSCAQITGSLPVVSTNTPIYYYGNSAVSGAEYDTTIANCVATGATNKTLFISSRRTSASDVDKATLISRGWTVNDSNV